jgi:hypothetical protein
MTVWCGCDVVPFVLSFCRPGVPVVSAVRRAGVLALGLVGLGLCWLVCCVECPVMLASGGVCSSGRGGGGSEVGLSVCGLAVYWHRGGVIAGVGRAGAGTNQYARRGVSQLGLPTASLLGQLTDTSGTVQTDRERLRRWDQFIASNGDQIGDSRLYGGS